MLAAIAGLLLRTLFLEDMEWKEDEHYNFIVTQLVGRTDPWPWVGMPSGVFIPNPGMSVWVFVWLARLVGAEDPVSLMRALAVLSWIGICLIVPFARSCLKRAEDRETWLWAFALAMVNPFAIYYQRKLWPEPFFPLFSMLFLWGWWERDRLLGAVAWGFLGAWLGQIHMSGFFLAAGFLAWTILFGKSAPGEDGTATRPRWIAWFAGSALGALPLLPWLAYLVSNPTPQAASSGLSEAAQLKFFVFWISDPLGIHLGNPLGLLRGPTAWNQISDFVRYPLLGGSATYLNGLAHALILLIGSGALLLGARRLSSLSLPQWKQVLSGTGSQTGLAQGAALWGFGGLLTLTGVRIRRYYMMVSFPLEFVWFVRTIRSATPRSRSWLLVLCLAQAFVSACLVGYVHVNRGAREGDYGDAFEVVVEKHLRKHGKPWPERPPMLPE